MGHDRSFRFDAIQLVEVRKVRRTAFFAVAFFSCVLLLYAPAANASLTYGLMWDSDSGLENAENWEAAKRSGATEFRMGFGPGHDWQFYDRVFRLAAEHNIRVLAGLNPGTRYPATNESSWFTWVKEGVERYGYNGQFWNENPGLPYKPVEAWEVANEPNLASNNPIMSEQKCNAIGQPFNSKAGTCVQPERYGDFLVFTAAAAQLGSQGKAGVGTQVLFGGLYTPGGENFESFLKKAYNVSGVYNSYSGLSLHPYGFDPAHTNGDKNIAEVQSAINGARSTLNGLPGGKSRPMWITELGWPLKDFGDKSHSQVKDQGEQARLLTESFEWVKSVAASNNKNIRSLYWYNDRDTAGESWDHTTGLIDINGNFRQAWSAFQAQTKASSWSGEAIAGEDNDVQGPHAVLQPNGTIDVFWRTSSGALGHAWYGTTGGWNSGSISGSLNSSSVPHVVAQANGTIDVFWRTPSDGLGHAWYAPCCGGWSSGTLPGTLASEPHPVIQPNGTIDVFWRTPSNTLGHAWKGTDGGWNQGDLGGAVASDPYPATKSNGTVDVFWRTPTNGLGHAWQGSGEGWAQGDLTGTLNASSDPRPIAQPNGNIDVFYRTPSEALGHNWYVAGGSWASGSLSGSLASDPHPVVQPSGTIDVFYRMSNGEMGHNWYSSGGSWASGPLGGSLKADPFPAVQPNGTIDVFSRASNGELGHNWYSPGGSWAVGNLAGSLDPTAVPNAVAQANGTIDVFYRTASGELGHNWYVPCCGGWFSGTLPGSVAAIAPKATSEAATGVSSNQATLNGTVNPEGSSTSYYFEYGTTTSYGTKKPVSPVSVGSGFSNVAVDQTPTGLSQNTTYHFRVVAESSAGGTTYGADKTFTTTKS
jgi:hypothetical protein